MSKFLQSLPPGKYVWNICSNCSGDGKHSQHLGDFSSEDLAEDPDFAADYFAGAYDQTCATCAGLGRVKSPRPGALSFGELRKLVLEERAEFYRNYSCPQAAAERRMGA